MELTADEKALLVRRQDAVQAAIREMQSAVGVVLELRGVNPSDYQLEMTPEGPRITSKLPASGAALNGLDGSTLGSD